MRLDKILSDSGLYSRKEAGDAVRRGRVTVDGVVCRDPSAKFDENSVCVVADGRQIGYVKFRYIMLNKPLGYVTTTSDEKGRETVLSLLDGLDTRVYPVGRLDMYSEGLLILTNDGELTNRLTHPKHNMPKTYSVIIKGEISPDALHTLNSPMTIDGYKLQPVKVRVVSLKNGNSSTLFTLNEGRNRQIRKMCDACGLTIMRLTRISVGKLKLGELERGKYRDLTPNEVLYLKGERDTI